jgi:hypothetical protein
MRCLDYAWAFVEHVVLADPSESRYPKGTWTVRANASSCSNVGRASPVNQRATRGLPATRASGVVRSFDRPQDIGLTSMRTVTA